MLAWISERADFIQLSSGSAIDLMLSISGYNSAGYLMLTSSSEFKSAKDDSSEFKSANEFSTL